VYTVGARGVTATTADDPAAQAAAALYQLLRERGVVFGGTAGSTRAAPEASEPLGTVESPPMEDLLRHTVQHSDNHLADAIFRSVGVETGDGSWSGSARAAATALEPLSMPSNGVTLADGSGLSRNNRVSAAALTAVQAAITSSRFGERWQGLMAVSGESGTLRERLRGTVAEHRLRGKTGSLHDVRALAGSVVGPDGEHYHLAVVANGLPAAAVPVARALQDAVVVAVAEVLYGCLGASPAGVPNAQGQVAAPACTP
jgi:D-alanyl-D-alanine carboxypeptidase/D-alanyl-D-alanine-endopeptidase (penicillin-binding protein 4)